jgi:hypothetical protein
MEKTCIGEVSSDRYHGILDKEPVYKMGLEDRVSVYLFL